MAPVVSEVPNRLLDAVDNGVGGGALSKAADKAVDSLLGSLGLDVDCSVSLVADEAAKAKLASNLKGSPAKADPLNPARDG